MAFKTSIDGTLASASKSPLASISGIPAMYGTGDYITLPSNENKITASDATIYDSFGISVAVGNGRIVVGAYGDNNGAGSASGSAYIFNLAGTQIAKITASDAAAGDGFGYSVAVGSGRIVVGAGGNDDAGSNSGSAYIFNLDGTQIAKITASDAAAYDYFGFSVAVDNGRIVVGAYGNDDGAASTGSAYIYQIEENFDNYIENIVKS